MKPLKLEEGDLRRFLRPETTSQKFWRLTKRTIKQLVGLVFLFIIFFIALNFSAYYKRFQYSVQPTTNTPIVQPQPPVPTANYAPELDIPKLSMTVPINMEVNPSDIIQSLKSGVVQYANTALPGENGNMVIVGHSSDYPWSDGHYKNVFAIIDKLQPGDQIIVPYKADKYIYEVTGSRVVKPTEISVLAKTDSPTLTLLTCYPVGTARNRLIVTAKLVSNNISGTQTTDPLLAELPTPR